MKSLFYLLLHWGLGVNAAYIISIALLVIAAYLLGSLNFGIIISSKLYHSDVRSSGSGVHTAKKRGR